MADAPAVDKTAVAQSANEHYRSGNYDEAFGDLTQLSRLESANNLRLQHNIAGEKLARRPLRRGVSSARPDIEVQV